MFIVPKAYKLIKSRHVKRSIFKVSHHSNMSFPMLSILKNKFKHNKLPSNKHTRMYFWNVRNFDIFELSRNMFNISIPIYQDLQHSISPNTILAGNVFSYNTIFKSMQQHRMAEHIAMFQTDKNKVA